jgi:signal transduction histidine kinase
VLLISVAAVIGVFLTYLIVEDVLTRQALNGEAEHFWQLYEQDPNHPVPDVANMKGYLTEGGEELAIPPSLRGLALGFGRADDGEKTELVHVSARGDKRLYLVFAESQVTSLVFYFGLAPLIAVLLTVYALLFLTYRLSHQAISPMLNLARALENFDFRSNSKLVIPVQPDDVDRETRLMVESLSEFSERLQLFVERERTFTRNAGHELRTPIAVLKGSVELLERKANRSDADLRIIERIRRVTSDMETLLETLLMLAREEDVSGEEEASINQIAFEQIELLTSVNDANNNQIQIAENAQLGVRVRDRVAAIIISNLLRNAISYTQNGLVTLTIDETGFSVSDNGIGISPADQDRVFAAFFRSDAVASNTSGQGLGLALVKRLCDQLGWTVNLESELGVGTTVRITLN